jgi:glutamyl-tRNA synthetase
MDHNTHTPVVTRFAPSPTGFLHIGTARTALFAWLFARQQQGTFILRIEDTDKNREVEGSIEHIIKSLSWLGIEWDFGPDKPGRFDSCLQSDRLAIYRQYAERLVEKGLAYPDPYTTEELAEFRDGAEREKRPFLFRDYRPDSFDTWDGNKPLRFKVPEIKRYEWEDVTRGKLSAGEEALDDFIILKADGYPTYNFAHIIDDYEMGVTHIMRGQEFIASTPKYLSLYDGLEIPKPIFVTLPPIMGPDGKKKLSKRDGSKDLLEYRADGYLPEAMRNFLALIGWNPGTDQEIFSDQALMEVFSLEKIQRSGGAFNEEKLKWMNKEHIKTYSQEQRVAYVLQVKAPIFELSGDHAKERQACLAELALERAHNLAEIKQAISAGEYAWVNAVPVYERELLRWKKDESVAASLPRLTHALTLLKETDFDSPESIKATLWDYAEEVGRGELLWPLRVALSGSERSPDPFTIAYIVGYTETVSRIKVACAKIAE